MKTTDFLPFVDKFILLSVDSYWKLRLIIGNIYILPLLFAFTLQSMVLFVSDHPFASKILSIACTEFIV